MGASPEDIGAVTRGADNGAASRAGTQVRSAMKQTGKVPSAKLPASDRRREVRGLFTAASLDEYKGGTVIKVVIRNRSQEKRRKTD